MLVYDYEIIYKKGKENVVVDALSRQFEDGLFLGLSSPIPRWLEEVLREWLANSTLRKLIQRLQVDPNPHKIYTWQQDTLQYKGCIFWQKIQP